METVYSKLEGLEESVGSTTVSVCLGKTLILAVWGSDSQTPICEAPDKCYGLGGELGVCCVPSTVRGSKP